ncbi:MAG: ATP synthase subunit I, partial [Methylothermaceae bacterium]|nr:ATP synthase subunit I [Methylothermaceae bacterium]
MTDRWMVWGVLVLAGAALGILFYGGLWITVRRLPQIHRPALWMTTSFILRMAGVVGGFYLLMAGDWRRLAALLLGFVPVRLGLLKCLDTHSLPTVST